MMRAPCLAALLLTATNCKPGGGTILYCLVCFCFPFVSYFFICRFQPCCIGAGGTECKDGIICTTTRARPLATGMRTSSPGVLQFICLGFCFRFHESNITSFLQVLNGGIEAEDRQDVVPAEEGSPPVSQSQPQPPVQPIPPRPPQFQQQPQRPLQRPPPRRPGPQRFPQGPPRRRPTRRPGRRTTTSRGILAGAVDAVSSAVGGVGDRLSCTGTNILTEAKLRDEAFIKFQLDCAMNVGPCDEIGEKIKSRLPTQ